MSDNDALYEMAHDAIVLENQIAKGDGPVIHVLLSARRHAAAALVALIDVDPSEPAQVVALQNEVKRYRDMIGWTQELAAKGREAQNELAAKDLEEIRGLVNPNPPIEDD